ncbi:MAG: hypothetical protein U9Q69_02060 [Nanoarchaeota archaeon]|nr:hypothetical protein [Nanoarchaeota archaeon]
MIALKEKLENKFKKDGNLILKKIKELTGIDWKQEEINVWIMKGWHPSISSPLLLNYYNYDLDFCFFNLIHELVHNNLGDFKIRNEKGDYNIIELEAVVNLITVFVLKDYFAKDILADLCKRAEFMGMYKYVWKRVKELQEEIDFSKSTIKKTYGIC